MGSSDFVSISLEVSASSPAVGSCAALLAIMLRTDELNFRNLEFLFNFWLAPSLSLPLSPSLSLSLFLSTETEGIILTSAKL